MECVVNKVLVCENCTEEQAHDDPWSFVVQEDETDMKDWEVKKVEENK